MRQSVFTGLSVILSNQLSTYTAQKKEEKLTTSSKQTPTLSYSFQGLRFMQVLWFWEIMSCYKTSLEAIKLLAILFITMYTGSIYKVIKKLATNIAYITRIFFYNTEWKKLSDTIYQSQANTEQQCHVC